MGRCKREEGSKVMLILNVEFLIFDWGQGSPLRAGSEVLGHCH